MEHNSKETKELTKQRFHVDDIYMEVNVPVGEEQRYVEAAEMVNRKIEAYYDVFCRQQYVPKISHHEILLMALLDLAIGR